MTMVDEQPMGYHHPGFNIYFTTQYIRRVVLLTDILN
jgi:hypothetical protein